MGFCVQICGSAFVAGILTILQVDTLILDNKHTQRYDGEVNIGKKCIPK